MSLAAQETGTPWELTLADKRLFQPAAAKLSIATQSATMNKEQNKQ